jgi:Tfp pilus assembly protein PilF
MDPFNAMKRVFCVLLSLNLLFGLSACRSHPAYVATQPDLARTDLLKLAEAHFREGKMNAAEAELRAVLNGDPRNNEAQYYLNLIREWRTKQKLHQESLRSSDLWYPTLPPTKSQ